MFIQIREAHSFLARLELASIRGSCSSTNSIFNETGSRDDERMMSLMNRCFGKTVTPLAAIVTDQKDQMNRMEKSGGDRFAELEKKLDDVKMIFRARLLCELEHKMADTTNKPM